MDIDENMREVLESNYLNLKLPFPDDFLLEMCVREIITNQEGTCPSSPKLPFLEIPVLKKSEKISIVCCIVGK